MMGDGNLLIFMITTNFGSTLNPQLKKLMHEIQNTDEALADMRWAALLLSDFTDHRFRLITSLPLSRRVDFELPGFKI